MFSNHYIVGEGGTQWKVEPTTLCQYTGLKDANGVDIYEGDLFDDQEVYWDISDGQWKVNRATFEQPLSRFLNNDPNNREVTGNIHES